MELLDQFSRVRIMVVGDVMLDRYWWGKVTRISPEAPVPVVRMERGTLAAGGAANVAANIAGLGATPILLGAIGDDSESLLVPEVLSQANVSAGHLLTVRQRPTTVKTRIIAHNQQVARIDQESDAPFPSDAESALLEKFSTLVADCSAVVVSDYAKGLLTERVLSEIISVSNERGLPILIDPKGKDYGKYRGATLMTPNRREAADACGLEENTQRMVDVAGDRLLSEIDLGSVLITQGEDGMTLFRKGAPPYHLETLAREVYDVTGAGDTVIAALAVAVASGADLETAADIANTAAGLVVEQVGTTAITIGNLREALQAV
jgi:D-beta-D-heptose 7-phosphate kinase/D-beta-D-heptose 1-phosphate adenosyltransferase